MHALRLPRVATFATAWLTIVLVAACGDSRVNALTPGISKDSVLKIIGQGAPAGDSLPNVYRRVQYFVDSKFFEGIKVDEIHRDGTRGKSSNRSSTSASRFDCIVARHRSEVLALIGTAAQSDKLLSLLQI